MLNDLTSSKARPKGGSKWGDSLNNSIHDFDNTMRSKENPFAR
mgnify:CR=1 FL=1